MKRPLVVLAVCFCAGIVAGGFCAPKLFFLFAAPAFICLASLFFFKTFFGSRACLLVFLLGILHMLGASGFSPRHVSSQKTTCQEEPCLLRGFVKNYPETEGGKWKFHFTVFQIQDGFGSRSCSGDMLVMGSCANSLEYGDELIVQAQLRQVAGDYGRYVRCQGISHILRTAKRKAGIFKTGVNRNTPVQRAAVYVRLRIKEFVSSHLSKAASGIALAMILGEKEPVSPLLVEAMTRAGTVHILVVSGFNVGIVLLLVLILLKLLRFRRRARLAIAMLAALFYCLLTGFSSPVARATVMAECYIAALMFRREADVYNCLTAAALVILAWNPRQLFEIGFQLSFASVAGIAFIYPRLRTRLGVASIRMRLARSIAEGFLVSFSAWAGTAGIIAYHFKTVSLVTCLANVVVAPLASCITVTAFLVAVFSFMAPGLASIIAYSLELMVFVLVKVNLFIAGVPGAYFYLP